MKWGLTRDEFQELVATDADQYPKTTAEVADELDRRGLNGAINTLNYLIRRGEVSPARQGERNFAWQASDIDKAASLLEERDELTPICVACFVFAVRYADYLRAINEAAQALYRQYPHLDGKGVDLTDRRFFVMHIEPQVARTKITFTPCADVLAMLERQASSHEAAILKAMRT